MKEFKFDVDGDGIAIPVIRCETQREFNQTVASYRTDGKLSTNDPDGEVIYIIYKDGSTFYHNSADVSLNEGKYKRTGILRGVSSNPDGYEVFGDFAIDEYGNIVIDEKSIEEYGIYAGQYDVKEQEAQEVQETVEQTVETIAEGTSEVETTEQAQAEENKDTFEYRNYIISGNERTGIIAIDNHGNFSPKVYKTVEEAKKAVDEDIEYAEKKYAEMEAEQTEVEETAETETEETIKTTAEQETTETGEGISKTETTTGTDDSGFEYYSVKVAYEVIKDEMRSVLFLGYSLALKVAEDFTDTWGGDKAIITAVSLIIRNDRQPESERDKRILETETAEIERRCVPYHDWGLSGYVSIEDRQDIA